MKIVELTEDLESKTRKMNDLEGRMETHMRFNDKRITDLQNGVDEARKLANDVEAHGRRWAIKCYGLTAPTKVETFSESKQIFLTFIHKELNITNIKHTEIDTAHRLGNLKNGNQVLLVRFFRREIVDYILKSKKMLKNTSFSTFEDSTALNQNLLFELKDRPEVEAAWILGGSVWVILHGPEKNKKKMKVSINDNLDVKLAKGLQGLAAPTLPLTDINPNQQSTGAWNLSSSSQHPAAHQPIQSWNHPASSPRLTAQFPTSTWNTPSSTPLSDPLNLSTSSHHNSIHSSPTNTNPA